MNTLEAKSVGSAHVVEDGEIYHTGLEYSKTRVRRVFSFTQMFFFALSYMSSWEAVATNVSFVFYNGGPRAVVWGFFIVIPGVLCQVASLAEMSSKQPIAGAQYHWTWDYAPPQYRRFITWMQGWITWFAWISLLAGIVNIIANMTTVIVTTSYPDYVVQGWHVILIMYAYLLVLGLINAYGFFLVPWIEIVAGVLHIALWIVVAVVLLKLSKHHSAHFVFFEKANLSGWNDDFVSFNIGVTLLTWGFVGFDATAHISEETRKARYSVPRAMFWSICLNAALAWGMFIIILFSVGNLEDVISSSYAFFTIALSSAKSVPGASAMMGGVLATAVFGSLGSITSASRLTWAWSRDGALPAYFSYVDPRTRTPARSNLLPIAAVMLLSLLNLANYTAFSVIVSLSTFGLYQSYFLAITCKLSARLSRRDEAAPWSLGKYGVAINVFALLYTGWLAIFMVFPTYLPITGTSMNYALPINAFVWIFAVVSWFTWANKNWSGLNNEIVNIVVGDADRDTKD